MSRRIAAWAVVLGFGVALGAFSRAAQDQDKDNQVPGLSPVKRRALEERAAIAHQAFSAFEQLERRGQSRPRSEVYRWSVRLMETRRGLAGSKDERVKAVEEHLGRVQKLRNEVQTLYRNGELSLLDALEFDDHLAEARGLVEDAKAER